MDSASATPYILAAEHDSDVEAADGGDDHMADAGSSDDELAEARYHCHCRVEHQSRH